MSFASSFAIKRRIILVLPDSSPEHRNMAGRRAHETRFFFHPVVVRRGDPGLPDAGLRSQQTRSTTIHPTRLFHSPKVIAAPACKPLRA
jgi:hypothetical protein